MMMVSGVTVGGSVGLSFEDESFGVLAHAPILMCIIVDGYCLSGNRIS